jgi:beta-phosphoglucomutase-like phosphatase (HAD superfamily)
MRFRGIIFDFNGVLWWDNDLQELAWQQFAGQVRGEPLSAEELAVHIHGRTNGHTLSYLAGRALSASEVKELAEKKESLYRRLCLDQGPSFRLSPGATDLLDFLIAQRVPHTIATASGRANIEFFVERLHLDRWFDVTRLVYDDGSRPGKPAPDIYRQAAHNLALRAADCVVVEDSRSGIQAAQAAGIGHVVALGPDHNHARLGQIEGVDRVIARLDELAQADLFLPQNSPTT